MSQESTESTEVTESTALVLAHSGELVDLTDERQVAKALADVQVLKVRLAEADRKLREAIAGHARTQGTGTLYVKGVGKLEIKNATETVYDSEGLEEGFRQAGMPEERIEEMFLTTVIRRPVAKELKRASTANPEYAKVIDACSEVRTKVPTVQIT